MSSSLALQDTRTMSSASHTRSVTPAAIAAVILTASLGDGVNLAFRRLARREAGDFGAQPIAFVLGEALRRKSPCRNPRVLGHGPSVPRHSPPPGNPRTPALAESAIPIALSDHPGVCD